MKGILKKILLPLLLFCSIGYSQNQGDLISSDDSIRVNIPVEYMLKTPDMLYQFSYDTAIVLPRETKCILLPKGKTDNSLKNYLANKADTSSWWGRIIEMVNHSVFIQDSAMGLTKKGKFVKNGDNFRKVSGKEIQSIRFKKIDIIEGSVVDTTRKARSKGVRWLNKIHHNTRDYVLRNQLLFAVGDTVNPLTIADNERILRTLPYIQDARILVIPSLLDTNKVELIIVTQDVFPIGASGGFSSISRFHGDIYTRNFDGHGVELRLKISRDESKEKQPWGYGWELFYPGFGNSFITGAFRYQNNWQVHEAEVDVLRDYISPVVLSAGGLFLSYSDVKDARFLREQGLLVDSTYKVLTGDFWFSKSFPIKKKRYRRNIRIGVRALGLKFKERPEVSESSNEIYFNRMIFLGNAAILSSGYYSSSMIFGMGRIEDVQVGVLTELTSGYEINEYYTRPYGGIKLLYAELWKNIGYLGGAVEYGTFFRDGTAVDGLLKLSMRYFSPLYKIGSGRNRNFLDIFYFRNLNRIDSRYIFFHGNKDIHLFGVDSLWGDEKVVVNMENVFFLKWNFWGFKFAPFTFADFTYLRPAPNLNVENSNIFALGGGMRIINESLVFDPLVLRFSYIPKDEDGKSDFKIKVSFELPLLTVPYFSGKPTLILN